MDVSNLALRLIAGNAPADILEHTSCNLMHLFSFYKQPSAIHPTRHAVGFRLGYMLATDVVATGDTYWMIHVVARFREFDRKGRISLILKDAAKEHPEHQQEVEALMREYKALAAKKNRNKQEILALRKTEKFIDELFEEAIQPYGAAMNKAGLGAFSEVPMDNGFLWQDTDVTDHERADKKRIPVSKLMRLEAVDNDYQKLADCTFLLPMEFMESVYRPSKIYGPDDAEALDPSNTWLE